MTAEEHATEFVKEYAPAKINLTLHVTGRRDDGYHFLDSLVAFVSTGDILHAEPAAPGELLLDLAGPFGATVPAGDDNLVLRAARFLAAECEARPLPGARLTLEKFLPPASGIGGGSADAAAAIRALSRLWGVPLPEGAALVSLGADVPVCLASRPARMRGIGQTLGAVPPLPEFHMVLVNPGVEVPTPMVFGGLSACGNEPMTDRIPRFGTAWDLVTWMHLQRNDLEAPAIARAPVIRDAILALSGTTDCMLARMSGSGATCFGMFETAHAARAAARAIRRAHPRWWVEAATPLADLPRQSAGVPLEDCTAPGSGESDPLHAAPQYPNE
ncbi:4-(cytidine 5'-diphospho)-2-C-methyl-D-erythritol kinase [Brevirhabdus pacifica]|uniref:4-diphosphocytidyl-2-C-methyl-D-erythritol kinase n=1 Tax=Brevirhabdus pacifica TaxID=1267768 RepID=A0A1U7DHS3_9RHOB|nr:4-(cytidine 5'-diphospho)-2-C-methyl-D-erythritol kinase [Brevirhabdus pacifica]APX89557.1 4-(cytidine 5'-diphospho)-2-C-methyl-D-erythritol kinase [Brevirhabdus pacifica]PJJ85779.1 4-diphosphocytidyl-2-C-methyl-D-erythritol kinase [Brevirhabdus pacifica]